MLSQGPSLPVLQPLHPHAPMLGAPARSGGEHGVGPPHRPPSRIGMSMKKKLIYLSLSLWHLQCKGGLADVKLHSVFRPGLYE